MGAQKQRRDKGRGALYKKTGRKWSERQQEWITYSYWQAATDIPVNERLEGTTRTRITGSGKTETIAIANMRANIRKYLKLEPEDQKPNARRGKKRLKLEELWAEWLGSKVTQGKLSDVMLRKYRRAGELHIFKTLGDKYIDEITPEDIAELIDGELPLKRKKRNGVEVDEPLLSAAALLNIYKTLSVALNFAENRNLIKRNPIRAVTAPKPTPPDENIPRLAHLAISLLDRMREEGHQHYTRFLFAFLGLRRAERLGLSWSNVVLTGTKPKIVINQQLARREGGGWYIKNTTKTKKNRVIPLVPPFLDALKEHEKRQKALKKDPNSGWETNADPQIADLVFLNNGKLITLNQDNSDWNALFEHYNWKQSDRFRGHAARHITGTMLADIDNPPIPEGVIRQILGWESVAMEHYYARVTQKQMTKPLQNYGEASFGRLIQPKQTKAAKK